MEGIQRGNERRELDELLRQYIQEQGYNVIEMYELDWWKMYKIDIVKQHLREYFTDKMLLREETLLEKFKPGNLVGYVQCDNKVPENLREVFANIPPIFKNINVVRVTLVHLLTRRRDFCLNLGQC